MKLTRLDYYILYTHHINDINTLVLQPVTLSWRHERPNVLTRKMLEPVL